MEVEKTLNRPLPPPHVLNILKLELSFWKSFA